MFKIKITTVHGEFTTNSDYDIHLHSKNMQLSGHINNSNETICIGDYVFKKRDVLYLTKIE